MIERRVMVDAQGNLVEKIVGDAKLIKRGVCPCGFPTLKDDIPIGKMYRAVLDGNTDLPTLTLVCGGCHQTTTYKSILVKDTKAGMVIYTPLPIDLFELETPNG